MRTHDSSTDAMALITGRSAFEVRGDGLLAVGSATASFDPGDITSLLTAHLTLVRKVRRQQREAAIMLRRDDVVALADLVGESAAEVIERLGTLMGATRKQRVAMSTLFAAGALVIGLASTGAVVGHGTAKGSSAAAAAVPVVALVDPTADPTAVRFVSDTAADRSSSPSAGTGAEDRVHFDTLLRLALDEPTGSSVTIAPPVAPVVPAATPAPSAAAEPNAPAVPASLTEAVPSPAVEAVDAAPTYDTDPSLVDIGSPPIPMPPEVIEEPWLAIDPPVPG